MLFRLTLEVPGYFVGYQESSRINLFGPHNLSVVLRHEVEDPRVPGQQAVFLEAWAEFDAPPKATKALREWCRGWYPRARGRRTT